MRIIGGIFKGRKLSPPAGKWPTRPTTDMAREALFNILENQLVFEQMRMLELFGGTGAHSIEAISRGCGEVVYVDQYGPCHVFVRTVVKELDIAESLTMHRKEVFRFLGRGDQSPFDYIFADPPFDLAKLHTLPDAVLQSGYLKPEGLFVLEHGSKHHFEEHPNFREARNYGQVRFSFFTHQLKSNSL